MEPQEVDSALDELENRLDRLRSLYEQYFMGIEKIEPTVPRKDVDRRFWILRRTQIRNTARRFRLQTLVQRYNTFQQHWARICREIENGTYVRHLLKAQKLGVEPKTWAAKKRLGLFRRDRVGPDGARIEGGPESSPPPSNGRAGSVRPSVRPSAPPSMPPSRTEPSLPPSAPLLSPAAAAPAHSAAAVAPALSSVAERRTTTESVATFRLQQAELRPLDLDLEDAPTLPPPARVAKPAQPSPGIARSAQPSPTVAKPAQATPTVARPAQASPTVARPAQPSPSIAAQPSPPAPPASPSGRPAPPRPSSAIPRPPMTARPQPTQAAPAGTVPQRPAQPVAASVPQRPAAPAAVPGAQRPVASPGTPAAPRPVVATGSPPIAATRPAATVPATRPATNGASTAASGLSDERVRQLHAELSAARKQLNQGATLSVDSLAKTLRDTEAKLRLQHAGKAVDFQVVIKDGKPIVKPVVRR